MHLFVLNKTDDSNIAVIFHPKNTKLNLTSQNKSNDFLMKKGKIVFEVHHTVNHYVKSTNNNKIDQKCAFKRFPDGSI